MLEGATAHSEPVSKITSRSGLARNTLINFLGQAIPLPVAIITFPRIIAGLGTERFGILSVVTVFIAYFAFFDFGLGRALTTLVSEKIGAGRDHDVPGLVWTASILVGLLGILGFAIIGLLAPVFAYHALTIPNDLRGEALKAFYWLAIGTPPVVVTSALTGILTALHRFDIINGVRIPIVLAGYVGPLLVLSFTRDVSVVVVVLVAVRMLGCLVYALYTLQLLPALKHGIVFQRALLKPLLLFGGWLSVTNIAGPLMSYLDRFLIGIVVPVASLAYYTVAYDLSMKVLLIPLALATVLFPTFTMTFAQDHRRTSWIYDRSLTYSLLGLFPVVLVMVAFAREGLTLWLGESFAMHGAVVLQLLAIGVLLNSLAVAPFVLVQGLGRPDLTAKLHLLELPFYLAALWWALPRWGIVGAALVWTLRVAVDLVALCGIAQHLFPAVRAVHHRAMYGVIAAVATVAIYLMTLGPSVKVPSVAAVLVLFGVIGWFSLARHEERAWLGRWLKRTP
ncbi:MAG TPA: flippase [Candidatus Methylomirabilis sp.]|nr:flippase [Candidatus Methylomirabilis sp.]